MQPKAPQSARLHTAPPRPVGVREPARRRAAFAPAGEHLRAAHSTNNSPAASLDLGTVRRGAQARLEPPQRLRHSWGGEERLSEERGGGQGEDGEDFRSAMDVLRTSREEMAMLAREEEQIYERRHTTGAKLWAAQSRLDSMAHWPQQPQGARWVGARRMAPVEQQEGHAAAAAERGDPPRQRRLKGRKKTRGNASEFAAALPPPRAWRFAEGARGGPPLPEGERDRERGREPPWERVEVTESEERDLMAMALELCALAAGAPPPSPGGGGGSMLARVRAMLPGAERGVLEGLAPKVLESVEGALRLRASAAPQVAAPGFRVQG